MALNFDYTASKAYCKQLGLVWLGDDFAYLVKADAEAYATGMTQSQVDMLMQFHMATTRFLWTPKIYPWYSRALIALYFLTGWKPNV